MENSSDYYFFHAVLRAAKALSADNIRGVKKADVRGLIDFLRSDKPISRADREILADLFDGELCPPTHRSEKTWQERRDEETLIMDMRERKAELRSFGQSATQAQWIAAEEFQSDPRALLKNGNAVKKSTLHRMASRDPYREMLGEASESIHAESAKSWESLIDVYARAFSTNHRARGKDRETIRRDLQKLISARD